MRAVAQRAMVGLSVVCALGVLAAQAPSARPVHRIAVFGSSVANGTGDESGRDGYAGLLRTMLEPRGWEVVNQSRGGDNTRTLMSRFAPGEAPEPGVRYLMPAQPGYVLIALSLGNEGIRDAADVVAKEAVFERYTRGIQAVVERSRSQGIVPVVTLCYTRNDFTPIEYDYTRRMNARINGWDVPSVNLLGAVDDGAGKWVDGFWWDSLHPNAAGHAELAATFVPTLFDALDRGVPTPRRVTGQGFARMTGGAALSFVPEEPMHAFALVLSARSAGDGSIATITGTALTSATSSKTVTRNSGAPPTTITSTALSPGASFTSTVSVRGGFWAYTSSTGATVVSKVRADGGWHQLALSHYTARGESLFFVDGVAAGRAPERLSPASIIVGGPAPTRRMDLRDLLIYRSALNEQEVASLFGGALLQASLEVYAPLAEARFERHAAVMNRAQSLAALTMESGSIVHVAR